MPVTDTHTTRPNYHANARAISDAVANLDTSGRTNVITGALNEAYARGHANGAADARADAIASDRDRADAIEYAFTNGYNEGVTDTSRAVAYALGWE